MKCANRIRKSISFYRPPI